MLKTPATSPTIQNQNTSILQNTIIARLKYQLIKYQQLNYHIESQKHEPSLPEFYNQNQTITSQNSKPWHQILTTKKEKEKKLFTTK
jgi:hypothetical protein